MWSSPRMTCVMSHERVVDGDHVVVDGDAGRSDKDKVTHCFTGELHIAAHDVVEAQRHIRHCAAAPRKAHLQRPACIACLRRESSAFARIHLRAMLARALPAALLPVPLRYRSIGKPCLGRATASCVAHKYQGGRFAGRERKARQSRGLRTSPGRANVDLRSVALRSAPRSAPHPCLQSEAGTFRRCGGQRASCRARCGHCPRATYR